MRTKEILKKIQEETLGLFPTKNVLVIEQGYYNGQRGEVVGIEFDYFHPFRMPATRADGVFLHVKLATLSTPGRFRYAEDVVLDVPRLTVAVTEAFWAKTKEVRGFDRLKTFASYVKDGHIQIVGPFGAIGYPKANGTLDPVWWAVAPDGDAMVAEVVSREDFEGVSDVELGSLPLSPSTLIRQVAAKYPDDPEDEVLKTKATK
jgi:hypothetical protein